MRLIVLDKVEGLLFADAVDDADLVAKAHAVELVGVLEQLGSESGRDELGLVGQLVNHVGHALSVLRVERLVDLVEQVEGRRIAALDGEYERERDKRLLATAQLLNVLHLVALAGEGDAYADARVLLDGGRSAGRGRRALLGLPVLLLEVVVHAHDEMGAALRHELGKRLVEVLGDLLERELHVLVLARVQRVDERLDGGVGAIRLAATLDEPLLVLAELDELVHGLLVDVRELLELLVAVVQLEVQVLDRHALVLVVGVLWQNAQVARRSHTLVLLLEQKTQFGR